MAKYSSKKDGAATSPQSDLYPVSLHVQIEEPFVASVSPDWLRSVALATLSETGPKPVTTSVLTLVVTDDETLRALNRAYLSIDAPTDVLSFGGESPDFVSAPDAESYLGDVLISYPRAQAQAAAAGHPVEAELALLVIHGLLHLLGYDHVRPDDRALMWERQADILTGLGLAHVQPAES
jgi:probable rRNA maturation factor